MAFAFVIPNGLKKGNNLSVTEEWNHCQTFFRKMRQRSEEERWLLCRRNHSTDIDSSVRVVAPADGDGDLAAYLPLIKR